MNEFIPVNEPLLDGNEKKYLIDCIETGWISSEGPAIKEFERKMAEKVGRKFGVAVSNASVALELAVNVLGISAGDEVILPSFTIISCAAPIFRAGAIPVVVDSDPLTWNMDISKIEEKITKRTKAIMIVHIYGLPADVNPILELAKKYNLKIIEDAAEMHGQTYYGKPCGSFGDISIFSFYPNKHITTGEGGMLLTDDEELAKKCQSKRNLCFKPEKRFVHDELGWNYRMTNLQAALGLAQLEKLDKTILKKRYIGKKYMQLLSDLSDYFQFPLQKTEYAENIYWVFGLVLKEKADMNAEKAMKLLADLNIGTRPFFYPMHLQPVFIKAGLFKNEKCPVAEKLAEYGFYIPSGLAITDSQIEQVSDALHSLFGG